MVVCPQPLSTIASAFDRFFSEIVEKENNGNYSRFEDIKKQILDTFDNESLSILFQLVPVLKHLVSNMGSSELQLQHSSFSSADAMASKSRLHHLFGLLVKALSGKIQPLLFFMDDLQWADSASLDLITSLIDSMGEGFNKETSHCPCRRSYVMFIGCYRSDEVGDSNPLAASLANIKTYRNVIFSEIVLKDCHVKM